MVMRRSRTAGYKPGEQVAIAFDPAASEFYGRTSGKYIFKKSDKSSRTSEQMVEFWESWTKEYPIISLEDGMSEDDWAGWKLLTSKLRGNRCSWWAMTSL